MFFPDVFDYKVVQDERERYGVPFMGPEPGGYVHSGDTRAWRGAQLGVLG